MIHAKNIHKHFGQVRAVRGVSFEVSQGEVLGILGPNGAGKTTTIRMITGSIPPTHGSVSIDGLDTINDTVRARARLGYLPEGAPFYPEMRVTEYLDYRAKLFGLSRAKRRSRLSYAVDRCALSEMARRRIGTLSKGYRQRVGLAAALIHDPPILILDEPTSGLDPAQIAETRSLIRDLSGDHTMLLVSHILPEVEKTCDRVLIFARGQIRADGPPATLVRDMLGGNRVIVEMKDTRSDGKPSRTIFDALPGLENATHVDAGDGFIASRLVFMQADAPDIREAVARAASEAGVLVRELRYELATLEELYIRLTSDPIDKPENSKPAEGGDS